MISHRDKTYGGFIDAVCDKAFVVPCWIYLLSDVEGTRCRIAQYVVLWFLILAEVMSGCVRFKAFYTSSGVPAPTVSGLNFSTSAVKADHVGKAKQTFEMVGTALFVIPFTRLLGLFILIPAVPLAYESVKRKITKRVIYVNYDSKKTKFDHKLLHFWMQAKGMGSKLVVGVSCGEEEAVMNACACASVDRVISDAPTYIKMSFLEDNKIDYAVCSAGKSSGWTSDKILEARRCLAIADDGSACPVEAKCAHID